MMHTLDKLKKQKYTHKCPECGSDTYCAMEAGKSINTCWCLTMEEKEYDVKHDKCLCKKCLGDKP